MPAPSDCPAGRIEDSASRPAGDGSVPLRVRLSDGRLYLFSIESPPPQSPDDCEAIARAVADHLGKHGLPPPAPDTRFAIEDQHGNLLAHAVVLQWEEHPTFTLYSPTGDRSTTWPPERRHEVDKEGPLGRNGTPPGRCPSN